MSKLIVGERARRSNPRPECLYCNTPIGDTHGDDCVLIQKKVKVRATIEYEVSEPHSWSEHEIEFRRNEGSWCGDNIINELEGLISKDNCLCGHVVFKVLSMDDQPFIEECNQ